MSTLGFTGTSKGMTQHQVDNVRYLFHELQLAVLHHGVCVGADAQAHRIAERMGARIVGHPPINGKMRAPSLQFQELRDPKPYLKRDDDIVSEGVDGLITAPRSQVEQFRGSGTWATIRRARKAGRRIWIVFPDGTFKEEHRAAQIQDHV